ncbi:MAG: NADH:flavin oxidoreductase [Clostridia bacterium]|nr:NADH:flavin oxidoreductase [Clostridia bacterium]
MSLLLQPIQIGSMKLDNRLLMAPIATSKSEVDGRVSREVLDYYTEKSKGGYLSLIIIEHSFISKEGKASNNQLSVAEDGFVEDLKKLSHAIHQNGTKAIMQINHAGSAAEKEITGSLPVAPSAIPHPRKGDETLHELTTEEIADIVTSFKKAAMRVKEAGFDGVEIHSAHGYLLNQFFSPLSNKRTDQYGGEVLNRIRIHLEVIHAVRGAVGEEFPIFLRLGASDYREGGTDIEDSLIAVQAFEKAGVNVLDISGGFCGFTVPGITKEQGYFAPLTEAIKKKVSIPVILTGGITKPEAAESLLQEKKSDLIGVGRAMAKDSEWAKYCIESLNI